MTEDLTWTEKELSFKLFNYVQNRKSVVIKTIHFVCFKLHSAHFKSFINDPALAFLFFVFKEGNQKSGFKYMSISGILYKPASNKKMFFFFF